jgi:nitrate reductase alpha subunit
MMGHARHGVHTMWRNDGFLLGLQRGVPDAYVNPDDAAARGVSDGDSIRIFNPLGEMICMAHVAPGIRPGMIFMFHGWDPLAFENRQNFSAVIATGGLIKPTSMVGDYGHLGYRPLAFAPNQTYKDFSVQFEKHAAESAGSAS